MLCLSKLVLLALTWPTPITIDGTTVTVVSH